MLLIYGKKTARIKMGSVHNEQCKNCKQFDISFAVYQEYFHVYYIPVWPIGPKNAKAWCHNCAQRCGSVSFEKEQEAKARTPFYFYTIPLLIVALIVFGLFANLSTQKEKAAFVRNPKVGDTYLIRKDQQDSTFYYFLKITAIKGDTVSVYHNDLIYFSYPTKLSAVDSFITSDPLLYTKQDLQKMMDADEINSVER